MTHSEEELVQGARERAATPLAGRERTVEVIGATAFVTAALAIAATFEADVALDPAIAVGLVVAYALSTRIRFETGAGYTDPSQLVLVPMLFLLPLPAVPAFVAIAGLIGGLPEYLTRRRHPQRALVTLCDSWYAVWPTLVLLIAGVQSPSLADWPVLVAALGAQFAGDLAVNSIREWIEYDVPPKAQLADAGLYMTVDALLAPVGLVAAVHAHEGGDVFVLLAPMFALLWIFARQHRRGLESALELSDAYRGTTLLLADVIEHDDHYTGSHSKGVVNLSLEVGRKMGLDAHGLRNVEFAALLHDVGKLAIDKAIINKEGPLSSEEWAFMRLHTVTGEQMLNKIGGLFEEVATIVRATHERWDGQGYPDGLAGVAIPLEARIVSCCDAFDAMTTDRSYRPAMPTADAVAELRANAGIQFDPGVVWMVVDVVEGEERRRFGPVARRELLEEQPPPVALVG